MGCFEFTEREPCMDIKLGEKNESMYIAAIIELQSGLRQVAEVLSPLFSPIWEFTVFLLKVFVLAF